MIRVKRGMRGPKAVVTQDLAHALIRIDAPEEELGIASVQISLLSSRRSRSELSMAVSGMPGCWNSTPPERVRSGSVS